MPLFKPIAEVDPGMVEAMKEFRSQGRPDRGRKRPRRTWGPAGRGRQTKGMSGSKSSGPLTTLFFARKFRPAMADGQKLGKGGRPSLTRARLCQDLRFGAGGDRVEARREPILELTLQAIAEAPVIRRRDAPQMRGRRERRIGDRLEVSPRTASLNGRAPSRPLAKISRRDGAQRNMLEFSCSAD